MHAQETVDRALVLSGRGLSDHAVARELDIPRSTVRSWRAQNGRAIRKARAWFLAADKYAYLLGQYLGDGHISATERSTRLAITVCDSYPAIAVEVSDALRHVFPDAVVRHIERAPANCSVLAVSHPGVRMAFPQHGTGKKHERTIELVSWQRALTHRFPEALIRGLIHSDGSRCMNRFDTTLPSGRVAHYEYVRYFFTNYSEDIRRIFCEHCELLGIRWTKSNPRNVSISHRRSVAVLERIVGAKA